MQRSTPGALGDDHWSGSHIEPFRLKCLMFLSLEHFTFTSYLYMPYLCLVRHTWLYTVR